MKILRESLIAPERDYLLDNMDICNDPVIRALIMERKLADLIEGEFVGAAGYDIVHPVLGRIEVKCTYSWHVENLTIAFGGIWKKKDKCDYFLFYSPLMDDPLVLIKHDDLFKPGVLYHNPKTGYRAFRVRVTPRIRNGGCSYATIARNLWNENTVDLL